jgi:endonuclease/exonuclease/phosphatase family metal-dependent hydrolase
MSRTGAAQVVEPHHLRFVTLNLWGENGPWAQRLDVVSDTLSGVRPDVVALQEVRDAPRRVPNQAETLARRLGWNHVFAPATAWGGGHEGLAILSKFPIGAFDSRPLPHSQESEGRIVLSARIDSDFGQVWVHNTHLSFREHEGRKREDQVLALDEAVTAHKNDAPQVLMGDFNAVPHSDEIRWLAGLTTLNERRVYYQDAWDMLHPDEPGYTWARENPYRDGMYWLRADRRLDYVFVTPVRRDRRGTVHEARLIFETPTVRAGAERVFASDHYGVLAEVQFLAEPPDAAPAPPPSQGPGT